MRKPEMQPALRSLAWMVAIVAASLGFSLGFACATPFAALAAVGGTQLRRGAVLGAVLLAWLGNQAIGYLALGYPRTWDSFAWGGAICVAAVLAALAAMSAAVLATRPVVRAVGAFAAAFVVYEGALFAAGFVLPSEGNAFALAIVARILEVNAVAFLGLLAVHRLALGVGLLVPPEARPFSYRSSASSTM